MVPLYQIKKYSPSQSSIFKLYRIQYYKKPVYLGFLSNIHLSVDVNQRFIYYFLCCYQPLFTTPFSSHPSTVPPFISILFSKVPQPKLQIMKLKRGGGTNSPPPEKQVLYPPLLWNFYISWRIPVKSLVSVQFIKLRQETFSNTHHLLVTYYKLYSDPHKTVKYEDDISAILCIIDTVMILERTAISLTSNLYIVYNRN